MHVFDASSILFAWDNYPIEKFPPLWNWMAIQVGEHQFAISQVAYDEVKQKSPECGKWLEVNEIQRLPLSNEILHLALSIKQTLGITEENYGKGVGENDLFIIATAKTFGLTLISEERRQLNPPKEMKNRKIPSVCNLKEVDVVCVHFIDLIKETDVVFK